MKRKSAENSGAAKAVSRYLSRLAPESRAALEELREMIRTAAPQAEEAISYGIPAFKLHGPLVAYAAYAKHCGFYVMSPKVIAAHRSELAGYDTSKGAIRVAPSQPLPASLVKKTGAGTSARKPCAEQVGRR